MIHAFHPATAMRPLLLAAAAVATLGGLAASAAAFTGEPGRPGVAHPAATLVDEAAGASGAGARSAHPGQAGLYDCGPGGKPTRLSQKSCGGIDRFGHSSAN